MAKAIPHPNPRQAGGPHPAARSPVSGPSYLTPDCGYSVIEGLLYCHFTGAFWLPGDPVAVDLLADVRPLVRNIRRARRELKRELRQTISPRRKADIRDQRAALAYALEFFEPFAEFAAEDEAAGVRPRPGAPS